MSLKWYQTPRIVALKSSTPVLEAARAIENNNIGAVIVQDDGRVVGIATDRDLAVRVERGITGSDDVAAQHAVEGGEIGGARGETQGDGGVHGAGGS